MKKTGAAKILFMSVLAFFISLTPLKVIYSQKIVSEVKHPEWSYDKTIYEVNVRQYTQSGTFNEFAESLPKLKELGVGIVWFMPIHPIGEVNRKGTLGSYYAVKDYYEINPEFGSKEDFKNVVKKIHDLGMYVIIDLVANHTSWDNPLVTGHPEYFKKDSAGAMMAPVPDWHDVVALDYGNKDLWKYMTDMMTYWVKEFDIDGYRCDVAGMVPVPFWDYAVAELKKTKDVFMLAEAWEPELHAKAFDASYGWDYYHIFNDIAKGNKNAFDLINEYKKEQNVYPDNAFRMQMTTNHDENSWNGTVFERMGDGAEMFAVLSFTLKGIPLIYSGQEAGLDKRLNFFERDPIVWKEHPFRALYTKLTAMKKSAPALFSGEKGGELEFLAGENKDVLVFVREKDGNKVLAAFNLTGKPAVLNITKDSVQGKYKEYFTGETLDVMSSVKFDLGPWGYKVYTK
jgi:glycosidase